MSLAEWQWIHEINRTEAPFDLDRALESWIADQVTARPDATAVTCGSGRLSYAQLRRRASQVAEALRRAGARPGRHRGAVVEAIP